MGVEYSLNDPAKGECFDFGKGWHEDRDDYDRPCPWVPLRSRDETLHYVTTHFWFLKAEPHSDECMTKHLAPEHLRNRSLPWPCDKWCPFNEPDLEYANLFADKLWTWLQGRNQSQLDVSDGCCSGSDIRCDPKRHDEHCEEWIAKGYGRHFFETGSRYDEREK
jgi:hypothetical protein